VVCFVDGALPQRCHHIDCDWRGSRLQVHLKAGARVLFDGSLSTEDRERARARLAVAMRQAEISQQSDVQEQLVWRQQLLRDHPVGSRLVHTYDETRICFCEVVSYSRLGHSVRIRQVESTAVDTWTEQTRYVDWKGMTTEVHKRVCVLLRAHWDRKTDVIYNVRTCHFGDRLVRGSDYEGRIEYEPAAISAAKEVATEPGVQVVNVRSLAGVVWWSAALGVALTTTPSS
jgi:hypothetical protein